MEPGHGDDGAARDNPLSSRLNLSGFGYEVVSHVGRGHSASARVVREMETSQIFVAKCVSLAALNEHDADYANQEASLLQCLRHPFVVAYHDSFLIDGANVLVIVMEYCRGGDLRKHISEKAQSGSYFSEDEVMMWFVQIVLALKYIHSEKVLHRDLKTSNIFLGEGRTKVKLGDFGIARVLEQTLDAAVTMVGTPYYMSPEVCSNSPYSWKSDIWALGCVLYEMCMLKHAFESSSLLGLVYKICSEKYEPIPSHYSCALNDLVRQLLSKSQDLRPSIEEILANPFVNSYLDRVQALMTPGEEETPLPRGLRHSGTKETFEEELTEQSCSASTLQVAGCLPELGFFQLDEHAKALIIASRVRRQLSQRKVNWIAALAHFDDEMQGALPVDKMHAALAELQLGLSQEEIDFLVQSLAPLQHEGARVSLINFEAQLTEAVKSPEVQQLEGWANALLRALGVGVEQELRARDEECLGILSPADFRLVLQGLAPELSAKHADLLALLSAKDRNGSIDYSGFVATFGAMRPRAPLKDTFMEFANAFGDPPPMQEAPLEGHPPPPPPPGSNDTTGSFHSCTGTVGLQSHGFFG